MSAFPKADIRDRRLRGSRYVRFWPKADVQTPNPGGVTSILGVGFESTTPSPPRDGITRLPDLMRGAEKSGENQ